MKHNWKKISVATIAAALILTAGAIVAFSQGPPGPPRGDGFHGGPGPRDGLGPMARDLNLTEDQKAQVQKITQSFAESEKGFHDQLRALHGSEPDPMTGNFDEAAVRAAAEARAKIQVELEVSHARMMSQISSVLTPEQKTKLAARHQQFERQGPPPPPPAPQP
jgi:Spy/CpxP family protein refolding chaperone